MAETLTRSRPVGAAEFALVASSRCRAFPRGLPHPPIFSLVLNEFDVGATARTLERPRA